MLSPDVIELNDWGSRALGIRQQSRSTISMTSKCPQKHGGFDVTGVQLGYAVNAVYH